jgi:hypothetical protein
VTPAAVDARRPLPRSVLRRRRAGAMTRFAGPPDGPSGATRVACPKGRVPRLVPVTAGAGEAASRPNVGAGAGNGSRHWAEMTPLISHAPRASGNATSTPGVAGVSPSADRRVAIDVPIARPRRGRASAPRTTSLTNPVVALPRL